MADEANPFDAYAGDTATLPPPTDTPSAAGGKVPADAPNPFDAFQDEATDTLKAAPPPTPMESFVENLKNAAGGLTKQATQTAAHLRAESTIRTGNEKGVAAPQEGFQTEKPTQTEYDKAIGDLAVQNANRHRWDAFQSDGIAGKTAAFFGGAIGGLLDPVNLLPLGIVANSVRGLVAGAGPVLSNIAGHAGAFGLFTAGADAASQGLDIASGYQTGFDGQRTVMAGALGVGLGGTITGATTLIKGLKGTLPHQAPKVLEGAAKDREIARLAEEERRSTEEVVSRETAQPQEPAAAPATEPIPTAAAPPPLDAVPAMATSETTVPAKPIDNGGGIYSLDPKDIGVDANRFQFKAGGDQAGVTDRLQGVETWDPMLAGTGLVWRDEAGKMWIADGHQRLGLANRLTDQGQQGIRLNAFVLDSAAGVTDADARAIAATKNIAEGTGTPIDAAKMMREAQAKGIELPPLPPRSVLVRDGQALAKLSPEAFGMAVNEVVPVSHAAMVGRLLVDPQQQIEAMRVLAQAKPDNARQAELIVREIQSSGTEKMTTQGGLFGPEEFAQSVVLERAKIADEALKQVKRDKAVFGALVKETERIQSHGENVLDVGANTERLKADEQVSELLARLATRKGPVSDALTGIARKFKSGDITAAEASRDFLGVVRAAIEGGLDEGPIVGRAVAGTERESAGVGPEHGRGPGGGAADREANLATERTTQGQQTLMPGVEPVTDRARAEAGMAKPLRGGEAAPGGMFDEEALAQHELFMRRMGMTPQGPGAEFRRRANREQLPGEAETVAGPKQPVTDAEARDLKLNEQMKHIAERMGRRLELDGRFTVGGVLGSYKPMEGVLRIRHAGDVEVFSHELGHAVDQLLATDPKTKAVWSALRTAAPNELLPLDFNAVRSGNPPVIEEGVAEFLRMYITNPAYAAKQAPLTYGAFKAILNKTPNLASILEDAAKMAHTESGLNPTQVFTTMIAQPHVEGLEKMSRSVARYGIVPTMKDYATQAYAAVVRENVNFDRFSQALRDAGFRKTGEPIKDLTYAKDPDHLYRQMDGAKQSAVSIIDRGVPLNLTDPFSAPRSPSITQALARAFNGSFSRIENPNDPLVKAFDGYLVARRAVGEWDLFDAGELRNQPVRASRAETEKAIKDFENQYPNFQQSGDDFFSFQRAYTQRMVDKGLWSQEMADKFLAKRQDHIPLYRDFGEDKAGGGPRNTKGGGLQFKDVHEFLGSTRDVVSPTRSVMQDVARRERRIAENEVWTALDDLAQRAGEIAGPYWEHVPNTEVRGTTVDVAEALRQLGKEKGLTQIEIDMMIADLPTTLGEDMTATIFRRNDTTPRGERIGFFYRGGQRQAVKMGDNEVSKHFFDLMTGMSAPEKDLFLGGVQAANAAFQASITHAPRFIIGTLIRDNMTRMFLPRAQGAMGRVPFAQDLSGIYTMMFDRSFYRAYQEQGGIRGGAYSHAAAEINRSAFEAAATASGMASRTLDELSAANTFGSKAAVVATIPANMVRASADYGGSLVNRVRYREGAPAKAWAVLTTPFKMVGDSLKLMEMGETASRVGNAKLTYNYLKKQGLSDVEAMAGGAYEARDVLNYNSRGSLMNSAPRLFPFLAAAITGADRSARGLIAEPIMAASRAMDRGGYANLDIKDKQILSAAWKNWTMISAVAGTGAALYIPYTQGAGKAFYDRASKYMQETYYLIQTGEDDEGRPVGLSIHKGYDVSAAMINVAENFAREVQKHDPVNWMHVMSGLKEAIPRQFRSPSGLLEAAPGVRTAYEVQTGTKLGFEGGPARPLIPDALKGLPPEKQATAMTTDIAKKMGAQLGVSPIVIDHVLNSSGTGVQDVRDLSSAVFDNNPLLTTKDALNRFFFGQVYRTARGDVGAGQDLRDVMARNTGSYQQQANAYKKSLEAGDTAEAGSIYNRADDASKTLMTLQSSVRFDPSVRELHPLVRSQTIADNVYAMMRDLGKNQILVQDKAHRRGEPRKVIELSNEQTRQVHAQLNGILSEETRNGLAVAGHPGYEDFNVIDTHPRIEILRHISPEVAKEYEARMKAARVLPAQGVADQWAETKRRLLQDQRSARLSDLVARARAHLAPTPAGQ